MKNPLITHLHILQLEGYSPTRFLKWWVNHPFKFKNEGKLALIWTNKAKFIYAISLGFWPLMFLALLILKPYEIWNRNRIKSNTRTKIDYLKSQGLRVIGITGSFGKSSTKEILYQILNSKYKVLRTPESYNTLFGIAKVVDLELDENYQIFICEMGAYKIGEITELCDMVDPDLGILTGINEQHLERFGSIENTIAAKFELVDYVNRKLGKVVANIGNELIAKHAKNVVGYGQGIYENPMTQNAEGAKEMAKIMGMTDQEISFALKKITPMNHRLSLIKRGDMTVIDDAFSSNIDGFKAAIKYLETFNGWKVIITPGIAELGKKTAEIHQNLGALLTNIDQVILVGKNERTRNLEKGCGKEVVYVERVNDALSKVSKIKSTVLFENDLPDNY